MCVFVFAFVLSLMDDFAFGICFCHLAQELVGMPCNSQLSSRLRCIHKDEYVDIFSASARRVLQCVEACCHVLQCPAVSCNVM